MGIEVLLWATGTAVTGRQLLAFRTFAHQPHHPSSHIPSDPFEDPPSCWSRTYGGIKSVQKIEKLFPFGGVLPDPTSLPTKEQTSPNLIEAESYPVLPLDMLPRKHRGIVEAKLKVHGPGKIYVIDALVFLSSPTQTPFIV